MPILVRCPECGVKSQYADRYAGQTVACKSCGEDVDVVAAGSRGGGKKSGKRKKSDSGNVLVIAGVLGGLVVLGIVGAIGLFVVMNGRNAAPPATVADVPANTAGGVPATPAQPAAATPGTATPAAPAPAMATPAATANSTPATSPATAAPTPSGFQAANSSTRLSFIKSAVWEVVADPPTGPVSFASQKPFKIKLPSDRLRGDTLLYPATASELVAVRTGTGSRDVLDFYNLTSGQKVNTIPGASGAVGFSPDGQYVASSTSGGKSINVYDVKGKKPLGELATADAAGQFRVSVLAMPIPERLVAISQLENGIKVWELPSGNFVTHIVGGKNFYAYRNYAFSPGGRFIAVNADYLERRIEIYDLTSGKLAGSLSLKDNAAFTNFAGFAFSPDGTELAAAYEVSAYGQRKNFSQFAVWNLATGQLTSDFDIEPGLKEQLDPPYAKERLEAFPNGRRWLVYGLGIIDRDQKGLIYSFFKPDKVELDVLRRPMGDDWVVGVASERGDTRLESVTIDEELIASAVKTAASGGLSIDTSLPPLTACDGNTASTAVAVTDWKMTLDPGPAADAWKGPITVESGSGAVRDIALNQGGTPIVVVRIAQNEDPDDPDVRAYESSNPSIRHTLKWRRPKPVADKTALESFNGTTGDRINHVDLPYSGELMSVSPDGQQALMLLHRGKGRLDVFSVNADGKHVVGWRPYRTAEEERHREIFDAAFVDNEHVATLSTNRILIVWKLAGMVPVFQVPEVQHFAVSPGGKTLAVVRGNSLGDKDLACFDSRTGDGLGILSLDTLVSALAFHPSGKWLAISHGNDANRLLSTIDVAEGQVETRFPVPDMAEELQWTSDDYLLLSGRQLVSKPLQAVVWSYEANDPVFPLHPRGGPCIFAMPSGKRWQVRSVELPQSELTSKLEGSQLAALALVKPGDTVSVKVTVGNEPDLSDLKSSAEDQAKGRLEKASLKFAEGQQPIEVAFDVTFKTGGTAQMRSLGGGAGGEETVTQKSILVDITYRLNNKVIWQTKRAASNFDRHIVRREPGESGQAAIDRLLKESGNGLIGRIELPTYVFSEKARGGLGTSKLASVK